MINTIQLGIVLVMQCKLHLPFLCRLLLVNNCIRISQLNLGQAGDSSHMIPSFFSAFQSALTFCALWHYFLPSF